MARSPTLKIRMYLHLVPVLGMIPSLWALYGSGGYGSSGYGSSGQRDSAAAASGKGGADDVSEFAAEASQALEASQVQAASRLSVVMGVGCASAITLLGASASTQASQLANLRFLMASSFVGSGYFVLSLVLMFRIAKDKSIRLPGVSQLSRRLLSRHPDHLSNRLR